MSKNFPQLQWKKEEATLALPAYTGIPEEFNGTYTAHISNNGFYEDYRIVDAGFGDGSLAVYARSKQERIVGVYPDLEAAKAAAQQRSYRRPD
jgi:predicted RNA methylase